MTTDRQPSSDQPVEAGRQFVDRICNRTRECSGSVLMLVLCGLIVLALVSFDPNDGGWSSSSSQGVPENLLGRFGAYCSDILLSFLGYSAYLIPLVMFSYALHHLYTGRKTSQSTMLGVRLLGFIVWVCANATLASLHFFQPDSLLPSGVGGVVGEAFTSLFQYNLGLMGATLIMLALWLAGVSLLTGWSWLLIIDALGYHAETSVIKVFEWLRQEARDSSAGLPEQFSAPEADKVYQRKMGNLEDRLGNRDHGGGDEGLAPKNKYENSSKTREKEDNFFNPDSFMSSSLTQTSLSPQEAPDDSQEAIHKGFQYETQIQDDFQVDHLVNDQADVDHDQAELYDEPQEHKHWFQRLKNQLPLLPPIFSLKESYRTPEYSSERVEPELSLSTPIAVDETELEPHLGFSATTSSLNQAEEGISSFLQEAFEQGHQSFSPQSIDGLQPMTDDREVLAERPMSNLRHDHIEDEPEDGSPVTQNSSCMSEVKHTSDEMIGTIESPADNVDKDRLHDSPEDTASTLNGWGESGVSEEGGISFESLGKSPDLNRHS